MLTAHRDRTESVYRGCLVIYERTDYVNRHGETVRTRHEYSAEHPRGLAAAHRMTRERIEADIDRWLEADRTHTHD